MNKVCSSYRTAWHLTESARKHLMALLAVITIFKIEVPLVIPYMIRWVFEAVEQNEINSLFMAAGKGLIIFTANIFLMYFINVYGDAWAMKLAFCAAEHTYMDISKISVCDMKRKYANGDLFNRVASGTGQIVGLWFATIDLVSALTATVIITLLFALQAKTVMGLALLLIAMDVIRVVILYVYVKQKTKEIEKKRGRRLEFLKSMVTSHTFHVVNGTEKLVFEKYKTSRLEYLRSTEQKINFVAVCDAVSEILHNLVVALLGHSYFALKQQGVVTTGQVNSSYNLFSSLKDTVDSGVNTMMGMPAKFVPIERLNCLLEKEEVVREFSCETYNISYQIDGKEILKDISIHASKGEKIAVIGDNGCGKSTILKCISGILNGEDMGRHNFGEHISYLPAEYFLFNSQSGSVNINMGNELTRTEQIKYMTALAFSEPESILDQPCGNFSGGEKQRIALIRSVAADKELLLLDEPTSALDQTSIACVKEFIQGSDKTLIYVTHLPELTEIADRIYIIKDGEIADCLCVKDFNQNENYQRWLSRTASN